MGAFVRRGVALGLVGGVAIAHVALVGLVAAFEGTAIVSGILTLGTMMPASIAAVMGWAASRPIRGGQLIVASPLNALAAGAVAGTIAGLVAAALAAYVDVVSPRGIFINASPALVTVLRFGLDPLPGSLLLVLGGSLVGAVAGALNLLPPLIRRAAFTGIAAVLLGGLLQVFISAILSNLPLALLRDFIYQRNGFSPIGAVAVFAAFALGVYSWGLRGGQVREAVRARPVGQQRAGRFVAFGLVFVVLLLLPQITGVRLSETLGTVGIYVLLGLGLNIVVGFAGLLDLGYVAFFAVGAYATAILTSPAAPFLEDSTPLIATWPVFNLLAPPYSFFVALPVVMLIAAVVGLAIGAPVLRLRGDYLAIVTLGLGEIARLIFLSDALRPAFGGAQGILTLPEPAPFARNPQAIYYPIFFFCVLAALAAISLANSRIGRAWNAMREDETVAEATGISIIRYKLLAFSLGAVFGCIAGAFVATKIGSVFPNSFSLQVSINALALIILGGMGNILGVIVGATVLVGLPELLRDQFSEYRLLMYGAVLVAMMLLRPEGLIPSRSRRAELHERNTPDAAYAPDVGEEPGAAPAVTA